MEIVISYEEAIRAITMTLPDVVLVDIRLFGEKSGLELAETIQMQYPHLPIVFLTSQYDVRVSNKALELNPSGYLVKPVQKRTFMDHG